MQKSDTPGRRRVVTAWTGQTPRLCAALLTACILSPQAAVIDDMNPCHPDAWDWNKTDILHSCEDGQLTLRAINDLGPRDPALASLWRCGGEFGLSAIYNKRGLPLREGEVMELRVDNISANRDGVFSFLVYGDIWLSADLACWYALARDLNEVVLLKSASISSWADTVIFWENVPPTEEPVTIVLELLRQGDTLRITARLRHKADPTQVVFERTVYDGPGVDFNNQGLIGPNEWKSTRDIGEPYMKQGGWQETGIVVIGNGGEPLPEMVLDNLEYSYYSPAVAELAIEQAVKLEFFHTADPQVVLSADGVDGPWTPRIESLNRVGDRWEMAVPLTDKEMFFKLARGLTTADDFEAELGEEWLLLPAAGMEDRFAIESVEAGPYQNHRLCFTSESGSATEDGGLTPIPAVHHVVDCAGVIEWPLSGHAKELPRVLPCLSLSGRPLYG
jgi:hypothetical protein